MHVNPSEEARQAQFNFPRAELESEFNRLGLLEYECRVLLHIWKHGVFRDNKSGLQISIPKLASAIGYSINWAREARDNLIAFGLLFEHQPGPGAAKVYLVDWTRVRRREPARDLATDDVFFNTAGPVNGTPIDPSTVVNSTPPLTPPPGGPLTTSTTPSTGGSTRGSSTPSTSSSEETAIFSSGFNSEHNSIREHSGARPDSTEKPENWGRAVPPDELKTWSGRQRLFERALAINGIDRHDREDVVWFIAACMCASDRGGRAGDQNDEGSPAGMLLWLVRHHWRKRGSPGVDGHWIAKATDALALRARMRRESRDFQPTEQERIG